MRQTLWICALALAMSAGAHAQITLVKDGKPKAEIVLTEQNDTNRQAAELLQDFVKRISGTTLNIADKANSKKAKVLIGGKSQAAGVDGFTIDCADNELRITSGGNNGCVYGVVTLLEDYLGVKYYAADTYTLTKSEDVKLPAISRSETPAFRYRQSQIYCNSDPIYKMWFRFEEPNEVFVDNMWVHTFDKLMPADVYGQTHPEYYSFFNGKRNPGNHSQLCLTNPDVYAIIEHKLDSVFKANPGKNIVSVSQNDGNYTFCTCEKCQEVNEYEGSPAGTYVRFMNRLAERFPDKEISTLAYLFTMHPPKHVKPRHNVNIMLCDIDCKREVPLTDNESGQDFVRAMEGWSKISDNIFIWDYCINFDNMVAPFPNFHILQKNIKLFEKNHANMLFEQAGGSRGCDFAEMRAYVLSKLMWNPNQDTDSLMLEFMQGYYGAATPYLFRYQKIMQGGLLASRVPLWIYDSPVSHKDGMLNLNLQKTYDELFDQAEQAVADDAEKLAHVQLSRLPLLYAELEIDRTFTQRDIAATRTKLDYFRSQCRKFGVRSLNENNNLVEDYCDLYEKRYLPQAKQSIALGKKVLWIEQPADKYLNLGKTALTDGLFGGTSFVESWVGWEGRDGAFIIDLGEEKQFSKIETDFLHLLGQWILLPKSVSYSVSSDGETYQKFGMHEFPEDRTRSVKFIKGTVSKSSPIQARYIKVEVKSIGMCPSWHFGVGHPAWFFMDEVSVF